VFIPNERKEKGVEQRVTGVGEFGWTRWRSGRWMTEIEQALDVASCYAAGGRVEQEWSVSGGGLVSPPDPNKGDS
jgi:hypothetical protein